jgi:hypothetical protein
MSYNPACLQLTEATLAYPRGDLEGKEEITLWGPETGRAMPGAAEFLRDEDAYNMIHELATASGMLWDYGPHRSAVHDAIDQMEEWEEHGAAYDEWLLSQSGEGMEELHAPSLFTEYNQGTGESQFVGADQLKKNMKIPEFTPEMLCQREDLNSFFNFKWNDPQTIFSKRYVSQVPDQTELLTLTAVGDNHGVAKCIFGAVFIPKGAITHLQYNGGAEVGTIFDGEITFTPQNKFPWRLKKNGITFTYEDMCGTRKDDY